MAFPRTRFGFASLLACVIASLGSTSSASAHHIDAYAGGTFGGYYGGPYEYPAYTAPIVEASYGGYGNENGLAGYRCYYRGKDGSCMNYSYQHGPSYGWSGELYGDPYISAPYATYDPYRYGDPYVGRSHRSCRRNCRH